MPEDVIEVVNDLGIQDGMPSGIEFATYIMNQLLQIYLQTRISTMTTVMHPTKIGD